MESSSFLRSRNGRISSSIALVSLLLLVIGVSTIGISGAQNEEDQLAVLCTAYGDGVSINRGGITETITFEEWLTIFRPELLETFDTIGCSTSRSITVLLVDNTAGGDSRAGLAERSQWGFAPRSLVVAQGDIIEFVNPSNNARPHTITTYTQPSGPAGNLTAGAVFDSSPPPNTFGALIRQGDSFVLDTSEMEPGHYAYYCRLHPWMQGIITVTP